VSSQRDTEQADLQRERGELAHDPASEHSELAKIYVDRGLDPETAKRVAEQLMAHDALAAHARDELGVTEALAARPIQAALASAGSFAVGAVMPLIAVAATPAAWLIPLVAGTSLVFLGVLGALAASAGGAGVGASIARVVFWGALAMGITAGAGRLFGGAFDGAFQSGLGSPRSRNPLDAGQR
jgi:VIT1/CCC1 family predicted Fe2+/Mn2+ transporter